MKVVLLTFNAKYIHKALSLRWLYVARNKQHDTEIVEFTINDNVDECVDNIISKNPDVVGISVYIWNVEITQKFIVKLKERNQNIRIIIGGPEVSYEADDWLSLPIEAVIKGEGEISFWSAVDKKTNIDGYFSNEYKSDCEYAYVDLSYLETLESPYYLDFDMSDSAHRYFYFEMSRGCPYKCSYCLSSLDSNVRYFSKEYIETQLTRLNQVPVKQVKFLDRTFNANPEYSLWIAELLEKINANTTFQFEIVLDRLNYKMLDFLLNKATVSFYRFEVGIQSFNTQTLKAVHRYQDNEKLLYNLDLLSSKGYIIHADLIGGLPYEDIVSFEKSYNTLFNTSTTEIQVGLLKLLKGTELKNKSSELDISYCDEPPYTVIKTNWLSSDDVNSIEDVYHATEKLYNSNRLRESIKILVNEGYILSPFDFMKKAGKALSKLKQPYQISDLFLLIMNLDIDIEKDKLEAILLSEYMMLFKQKPKRIFSLMVSKEDKKEVYKKILEKQLLDEQTLYNYCYVEYGYYQNEIAYQVIIYDKMQKLPKRLWIYHDDIVEDY